MQKAPNRACCNLTFPHSHHAHCAYRISVWSPEGGLWAEGRMVLITAPGGGGHCSGVVCLLHSEVVLAVTMLPCHHRTTLPWYHDTMVPWYHRIMVPCYHGTMVPWARCVPLDTQGRVGSGVRGWGEGRDKTSRASASLRLKSCLDPSAVLT